VNGRIVGVSEGYLPVVVGVAVVADHVLRLLFSDATAGDVASAAATACSCTFNGRHA
jgi:hypothetical protein